MKKHLNKDIKKKAVEAHAKGMTITSLCETYDVHRHTVRNWIKRSKTKKVLTEEKGAEGLLALIQKKLRSLFQF